MSDETCSQCGSIVPKLNSLRELNNFTKAKMVNIPSHHIFPVPFCDDKGVYPNRYYCNGSPTVYRLITGENSSVLGVDSQDLRQAYIQLLLKYGGLVNKQTSTYSNAWEEFETLCRQEQRGKLLSARLVYEHNGNRFIDYIRHTTIAAGSVLFNPSLTHILVNGAWAESTVNTGPKIIRRSSLSHLTKLERKGVEGFSIPISEPANIKEAVLYLNIPNT